jgi:peptidoglycan-N-acetylglucosamine deacetylase
MPHVVFDCFPGGRRKCLTMSYDDGVVQDRRLVEIFNRYGIRGTFHLNSGALGAPANLRSDEVKSLFAGHEVSVHGVTHPCLSQLPREEVIREILDDRRALEGFVGYVVRGMSYPGGDLSDGVVAMLPHLGIEYARTVWTRPDFLVPEDLLRWRASCHHSQAMERGEQFLKIPPRWGLQLFYVWGHSYEFDSGDGWAMIESFCQRLGRREEIWYATNIEIVDYVNAIRAMRCSADGKRLHNPSSQPVWFSMWELGRPVSGPRAVKPGETLEI